VEDLFTVTGRPDAGACQLQQPNFQQAINANMAVVLRYIEGLAYGGIAKVLNCSPGTVGPRLNRAHKALESKLAPLGERHA
jgi:DNA-directed RNA polymerase specialized sigma24 family protein